MNEQVPESIDTAIVGAGVVGLATACAVAASAPGTEGQRRVLAALVGVMDDRFGPALPHGHLQMDTAALFDSRPERNHAPCPTT